MIDVSKWTVIRPEEGGKDARKSWVTESPEAPREDWWLWKPLKPTDKNDTRTNDVAEVVAHRLAAAIGLPAARCEYAVLNGERGVISRNMVPSTHEMASGAAWGVPAGQGYTVERILGVLDGLTGPPPHHTDMTAADVFTWWGERVTAVSESTWTGILDDHGALSEVSLSFVSEVLRINQARVSSACRL